MAKTYAPQLARQLKKITIYVAKHSAKIGPVLTAQQQTDLNTIVAAINSSWSSVQTTEQP